MATFALIIWTIFYPYLFSDQPSQWSIAVTAISGLTEEQCHFLRSNVEYHGHFAIQEELNDWLRTIDRPLTPLIVGICVDKESTVGSR